MNQDPFPPADFDAWAESYDQTTRQFTDFPFAGYDQVLQTVVERARPRPGMSVLDLGTGTGNLAALFDSLGCDLWCTDFAPLMLDKARPKLSRARFALHDLRAPLPTPFDRPYDAIVSAYVFHHFELPKKVDICRALVSRNLAPGGRLVIADLSWTTMADKESFRQGFADWEEEFYWFADESLAALAQSGLQSVYEQVSPCAGVYTITP